MMENFYTLWCYAHKWKCGKKSQQKGHTIQYGVTQAHATHLCVSFLIPAFVMQVVKVYYYYYYRIIVLILEIIHICYVERHKNQDDAVPRVLDQDWEDVSSIPHLIIDLLSNFHPSFSLSLICHSNGCCKSKMEKKKTMYSAECLKLRERI